MKLTNKNKQVSAKKNLKNSQSPPKHLNRYDSPQNQQFCSEKQWVDQMIEFHLHDEQPESIIAKRKLEQISVQLNEETAINSFKRNQNSIQIHKIGRNASNPTPAEGWIEDQVRQTQKSQAETASKHKRSQSASQCTIRQTLKIKTQNEKKLSFSGNPVEQKKLNLSFTNLSPFHMQTIPQTELSNQLVKKIKSSSSRRPVTASYYGASQKVLTLFDKETTTRKNKCETIRIHSNKEIDPKAISCKDVKFLKTFSFNAINKSLNRSRRGSKKVNDSSGNEMGIKQLDDNRSKENQERYSHKRTHSEVVEQFSSKQTNTKDAYGQYSQRKYVAMSQKRHILNKRIKSHENIPSSVAGEGDDDKARNSFSRESNLIGPGDRRSVSRVEARYDQEIKQEKLQQRSKTPSPNKNIQANVGTNLEQDFSLLISMLKQQSQNIFGGQIHHYLTQMKNNSLYNYYCSGGAGKKKNGKLILNGTAKMNKTQRGFGMSEHDKMRGLIEKQHVAKNNTALHYGGFSSSKYREKDDGQFFVTYGALLDQ